MARRNYWIYSNKSVPHNHVIITAIEDGVFISSITAITMEGEEVSLIAQPMSISKKVSSRYPVISSDRLRITIDHPLSDTLSLSDLLSISVGLENYNNIGTYIAKEKTVGFNKNLSVVSEISNILDVYIKTTLHLSAVDNYDNIVYTGTIPLSINDDGYMVEHANTLSDVELPYEPAEGTIRIIIDGTEVDEFTISGKTISFSAPDGYDCFIIYKPLFTEQGKLHDITENISINPSYGIQLVDNYCSKIIFSMTVEVYNPDTTSTNHTPIIKSLGLLASNR